MSSVNLKQQRQSKLTDAFVLGLTSRRAPTPPPSLSSPSSPPDSHTRKRHRSLVECEGGGLCATDEQIILDNSESVRRYIGRSDRERALQSTSSGTYSVLARSLSPAELEEVKHELTLRPKANALQGQQTPEAIPVYDMDTAAGRIHVPRPYGLKKWGPALTDSTCVGRTVSEQVRCKARPRDNAQRTMLHSIRKSYEHLRNTGSEWILAKADCGCGKTIMAVMHWLSEVEPELQQYACRWPDSSRPPVALFMPPTKILRDQWACEIRSICTDIKVFIMNTKADRIPEDADCIIALPHTVCLCSPDKFDCVGFTVLDEAHHLTAQTFWQAVRNVRSRRVLFLTATPRRNDGLTKELLMLTGPMAAHVERPAMPVHARFILYRKGQQRSLKYGKHLAYGKMLNWLCEDEQRNRDLARYIAHAIVEENAHRVLVISERSDKVKHLDTMAQYVVQALHTAANGGNGDVQDAVRRFRRDELKPDVPPERLKSRVPLPVLDAPVSANASAQADRPADAWFCADLVSVIRPGMLSYEQELAKCARVVFAPRKSCDQGFNKSDFTHEFYASPFTDVEQCDGRVQRAAPGKDKCVIYHVVDTFEPYASYGLKVWKWRTHSDRVRRKYASCWVDEDLKQITTSAALRVLRPRAGDAQDPSVCIEDDCDDMSTPRADSAVDRRHQAPETQSLFHSISAGLCKYNFAKASV